MSEDTRTLVLVSLPMAQTPIAPHRPGTYVVGYIPGDQTEANDYLNKNKVNKTNAIVQNAFLALTGIEFEPRFAVDPHGNPILGPNGEPQKTGRMGVMHGFTILPLTRMDAANGCDYGVEVEHQHWIFPKGSMIQDLETNIRMASDNLVETRSGLTRHPNVPSGFGPPPQA